MRSRGLALAAQYGGAPSAIYPLILLVLCWAIAARAGAVRPLFLPAFSTVINQLCTLIANGNLFPPLLTSLYRTAAGLALATAVGIPLGFLMVRSRSVAWFLDPLVALGNPAPKLALIPVFTLWFGIDHVSKIMLVALTTV